MIIDILKEITESDVGILKDKTEEVSYKVRKAARAVAFDQKGEIPILFVSKNNYHGSRLDNYPRK